MEPLPDVTLFSGRPILRFHSADQRHLLVTERVAPGTRAEYSWSIFSLETGERLGRIAHHRSHARFVVIGSTLTFIERPYGHRVDDAWRSEPRKVKTVLLDSAELLWERPLRDTTYRGPYRP